MRQSKEMRRLGVTESVPSSLCCGCGACVDACSRKALSLILNDEGFYRPALDVGRCSSCGVCNLHCPMQSRTEGAASSDKLMIFGGWSNDQLERSMSTSGGLAFELAKRTIAESGVVVGCVMGNDLLPQHRLINTLEELSATRGSKDLPSMLSGVYRQAAAEAATGRKVFFTGTPCQVAAFETFLKSTFRDNVLTADIVCFGVPSIVAWRKHLAETFHGKVKEVRFRDKATGWENSSVKYTLTNGKVIYRQPSLDPFVAGFYSGAFHQSVCGVCPHASVPRPGDITLGDFWGVPAQFADQRGVSLVVASSCRGAQALEALRRMGQVTLFPSTLEIAGEANRRLVTNRSHHGSFPHREAAIRRLTAGESLHTVARTYLPCLLRRTLKRMLPLPLWKLGKGALKWIRR
jgi:coenzyme F420-reducing hydrogenase beta subunit